MFLKFLVFFFCYDNYGIRSLFVLTVPGSSFFAEETVICYLQTKSHRHSLRLDSGIGNDGGGTLCLLSIYSAICCLITEGGSFVIKSLFFCKIK